MLILLLIFSFHIIFAEHIPLDLHYQENPITNNCMQFFLEQEPCTINLADYYTNKKKDGSDDSDDLCVTNFYWNYIGTLSPILHVITGNYPDSAGNTYCRAVIIKREQDVLHKKAVIDSVDFIKIKSGELWYAYNPSCREFYDTIVELYPEISPLYKRSAKNAFFYNEEYLNCFLTYKVLINPNGSIKEKKLVYLDPMINPDFSFLDTIDFDPSEGWWENSCHRKKEIEIKTFALDILKAIDSNKPDAFKEDGVAYSPQCFRILVENDIKDIDKGPQLVQLSLHKNDTYEDSHTNGFIWDYIGQYNNYYCIYVQFKDISHDADCYEGIYTIEKDGDYLKKVDRVIAIQGKDNPFWYHDNYGFFCGTECFTLEHNQFTYRQRVSSKYALLFKDQWPIKNNALQAPSGIFTWLIELSDEGKVQKQSLIDFT